MPQKGRKGSRRLVADIIHEEKHVNDGKRSRKVGSVAQGDTDCVEGLVFKRRRVGGCHGSHKAEEFEFDFEFEFEFEGIKKEVPPKATACKSSGKSVTQKTDLARGDLLRQPLFSML